MDNEYTYEQVTELAKTLAKYGVQATVQMEAPPSDPYEDDPRFLSLDKFPEFVPEDENDDILVRGRWLERGGAAFIVSTAGAGKSIHSLQTALCWAEGIKFSGLEPRKKLKVWLFQSEDSPTRVTIDREDIIAELTETHQEVKWRETCRSIRFVKIHGKVGAAWLHELDTILEDAKDRGTSPDVIIINPFLAFIGGPITDGQYVTPFLRGGVLNREYTTGLQDILERHRVGALIYHHTPKPPSEKEVDAWLKSQFPEYQGAGSSDITNWGRSFITMMKLPGHPRTLMLTAGKNGGGLGWSETDGYRRIYLHWSDGDSIDTGARHAWREATELEIAEATSNGKPTKEEDLDRAVDHIIGKVQGKAMTVYDVKKDWKDAGVCARSFEAALKKVKDNPSRYNLAVERVQEGRKGWDIIGDPVEVAYLAAQIRGRYGRENDRITPHHTASRQSVTRSDASVTRSDEREFGDFGKTENPCCSSESADRITPHHTASRDAVDRITQEGREYIYTPPTRDTVVKGSGNGDRITALGGAVELNEEPLF